MTPSTADSLGKLQATAHRHMEMESALRALVGCSKLWEIVALGLKARREHFDGPLPMDLDGIGFLADISADLGEAVRAIYDGEAPAWRVANVFHGVPKAEGEE